MKDIPMLRLGLNDRISKNPEGKHRRQSPLVRKWLRKYGINTSDVMKRGNCERLTKQDVETYMAQIGEAMLREAGIKQA